MSRLRDSRGLGSAAKNPRVTAILLLLGFLLPSLTLIWLAARAASNEQSAYEQALAQSRQEGAALLRREIEANAADWQHTLRTMIEADAERLPLLDLLNDGLAQTVAVYGDPPVDQDVGRPLQGYIDEVPYIAATLGPEAVTEHIRSVLSSGLAAGATRRGRSIEAWLYLAGIENAQAAGIPAPDLSEGLLNLVCCPSRSAPMPAPQRAFVLQRLMEIQYAPETVALLCGANDFEARWRAGTNFDRDREGISADERWIWLNMPDQQCVAVVDRPSFIHLLIPRDSSGMSVRVIAPGEVLVNAPRQASIDLGGSLAGWRLAIGSLDDPAVASGSRRWIYFGLGTLVTVISLLIVLLSIRLLRREMSAAQLKNDLVATVSHELKTPVASVQLLVETMLDDPKHAPEQTREYLEMIHRENLRLGRIVERFLTFSRLERGGMRFDFRETDVCAVCREAETAFRQRFSQGSFNLSVDCPDIPLTVLGEASALLTAILNLLENAWKYGGEGFVEIALRARVVDIPAHAQKRCKSGPSQEVLIEVADNGPGITAADQERLFQKFTQLDRRLTRHKGGVGLGLSIVASLVARHGGRVSLDSAPGRGSRFRIHLPRHANATDHRR